METIPDKESIFITGIDTSISEADLKDFLSKVIKSECQIIMYSFTILQKARILAEIILSVDDSILAHQQLNNSKLKDCYVKILPKNTMRSLIITNLPDIISEKDLFLLLNKMTSGLRRITIADNPSVCGRTLNLAIITYQSYELARAGFEKLKIQNKILGRTIEVFWKEPHFDLCGEVTMETKVIYIKNLSVSTDIKKLKGAMETYGQVIRIKKFQDRAFVEFDSIEAAKKVIETCNEKRFDGLIWKVYPAKMFDEERMKEKPDKNSIFSKNFLEEEDQQILLKFAFDGVNPIINPQHIKTASDIIQSAKTFQNETYLNLKQRHDILTLEKNTISASSSPYQHSHSTDRDRRESYNRDRRDSYHKEKRESYHRESKESGEYSKYPRTSKYDKYNTKQEIKQLRLSSEIPITQQGAVGTLQNNVSMYPMNTNPSIDTNLGFSTGMNNYQNQGQYNPNLYYTGQNSNTYGAQWNMAAPQQLVNQGNVLGQPQFFAGNVLNNYPNYNPSMTGGPNNQH